MKRILYILTLSVLITTGCAPRHGGGLTLAALRGPSSVGMIQLIDSLSNCSTPDIRVVVCDEPLQVRKMMLEGSADFAVLPTTMAALMYNKGIDYRLSAITMWGTLYLCGTDTAIRTISDLKGRKVHSMDKGLTPDILFRHLLTEYGVEPYKDIELDYRFPTHRDIASAALAGRTDLCVISEPFLSQVLCSNQDMHLLLNLNSIWKYMNNMAPAETALLCSGSLAETDPEIVKELREQVRRSVEWTTSNPQEAAALAVKYNINPDSTAVLNSIPRSNMLVKNASECRIAVEKYLQVFYNSNPQIIGDKMPDEKFFLN